MRERALFDRATFGAGSRLAAPGLGAVVLMVLFGAVPWWAGGLIGFAILGGATVLIARDTRDRALLGGYLDALADAAGATEATETGPPRAPLVSEPSSQDAVSVAARIDRFWRTHFEDTARERDHLAEVLAALHDPFLEIDAERIVRRANPAAQRLLGQRLTGRDLAEVMRHPAVLDAVDAVLAGGAAQNVEMLQPVPVERVFEVRVKHFDDGAAPADAAADAADVPRAPRGRRC